MARLTGTDATVFTMGATNILALYTAVDITINRAMIDISAVQDDTDEFADGTVNWGGTLTKLLSATDAFADDILFGGTATLSFTEASGGRNFSGAVRWERVGISTGARNSPQLENVTFRGTGVLTLA